MEQQEEKKSEGHGRRRQSKPTSSIPIDLISEILLKLPEKSLVRFRCVSKLWSSFITDPYFITLFETWSPPRPSLLVCIKKVDKLLVFSILQHSKISNKLCSFSQPTDRYQMTIPRFGYHSFIESVHGLICFIRSDETPMVWNPSKRHLLTLPKPMKMSLKDDISFFLGYNPIEGKHKLVCMPAHINCYDVCQVLTLGAAQESWRMVRTNHKHCYYLSRTRAPCIKGVIYYEAYMYETKVRGIMSFDVRSETFHMIQVPSDIDNGVMMMTTYEGKLACVKRMNGYSYGTMKLYILEDAEKHEWSSKDSIALFSHLGERWWFYFNLKGITHAGEFIYAPPRFCKSSYILFYDPLRNRSRKFEFKGITDDESWLNDQHDLCVFPNYIES